MTRHLKIISALFAALTFVFSCGRRTDTAGNIDKAHFSIDMSGKKVTIRTAADSITFTPPLRRLVCMSTSYVAYLSSVGAADAVLPFFLSLTRKFLRTMRGRAGCFRGNRRGPGRICRANGDATRRNCPALNMSTQGQV